jgi:hypothetical protein
MGAKITLTDVEEEQVCRIVGRPLQRIRRFSWVRPGKVVTVQFGIDPRSTYRVNLASDSAIRV